jgi:ubiquitin
MESKILSRYFELNGQKLPDPDPRLSVEEVRNLYEHISTHISPPPQSPDRKWSETSWSIASRQLSAQRGDPMSRNPKSKEVTKQAVPAELDNLRQGRQARYQTLLGRFVRCPDWQRAAALCAAAVEASARAYNVTPLDAPAGWLPPAS